MSRRVPKAMLIMLVAAITLITSITITSIRTTAKESQTTYYKTIQIEAGDTLWSIAQENKGSQSTKAYIATVKSINGLGEDTIHAGAYLTIPYTQ